MVRTELRHRWRSWLVLVVLVSVVGGVVMGAAAAGRRTASAFPRYDARYGFDVFVYAEHPLPALSTLPQVRSATLIESPANGAPHCACRQPLSQSALSVYEYPPAAFGRYVKLLAGRLPGRSSPTDALISFNFAKNEGIGIGSVVRVPFFGPSQGTAYLFGGAQPDGPTVSFRVVGIEAEEPDFPSVGPQSYNLITGRALAAADNARVALFDGYFVTLRHRGADAPSFDQAVQRIGAVGSTDLAQTTTATENAIHPQAVGWWVLALLAALAGLAVLGQALSRQAGIESDGYRTLSALGMGPRDLVALSLARTGLIAVAGAGGALVLAFLVSPLAPVGEARVAETRTGLLFDPFVAAVGVSAVVVAVLTLALWPAFRSSRVLRSDPRGTRRSHRGSAIVSRIAAAGVPPSVALGVGRALDRGRGREAVPVGSALGGSALAVAALCGTLVFGSSLSNLVATPRLYGQDFQVWFNGLPTLSASKPLVAELQADHEISAVTLGLQTPVKIDGIPTHTIAGRALRGPVLMTPASGRLASRPGEVDLGSETLRQVHARLGSLVRMTFPLQSGGNRSIDARIVGTVSFPPDFGVVGLGTGAYMSIGGLVAAQCPRGPHAAACRTSAMQYPVFLARTAGGAAGRTALARYQRQYPEVTDLAVKPTNLVNFGQAVNFPLLVGVVLVVFGLATLLHTLVVSVARRRRELGLFRALGLLRRQVFAVVSWQATTTACVGLVVGIPVGTLVGRAIWQAFAVNIGVVPKTVIEPLALVALAVGVLVVANVLAIGPALVSARTKASALLRSE